MPTINRNIPAYAGKTLSRACARIPFPEHPRVCGENLNAEILSAQEVGTSPRMRGKPTDIANRDICPGNIPAYAGKTSLLAVGLNPHAEHPRVCGENGGRGRWASPSGGTSPRMRGKRPFHGPHLPSTRNIPAYAGKTSSVYWIREMV